MNTPETIPVECSVDDCDAVIYVERRYEPFIGNRWRCNQCANRATQLAAGGAA